MANVQRTMIVDGNGIDPAWRSIVSESEGDKNAITILSNELSRRFSTAKGTYFTDPSYGLELESLLGSEVTADTATRLSLEIENQAKSDERVAAAKAVLKSVLGSGANRVMRLSLSIVPKIGEPFALTLVVSGVTVSLLKGS